MLHLINFLVGVVIIGGQQQLVFAEVCSFSTVHFDVSILLGVVQLFIEYIYIKILFMLN